MRGNLHVQFLGGWARATAPGYPAQIDELVSVPAATGLYKAQMVLFIEPMKTIHCSFFVVHSIIQSKPEQV